MKRLFLALMLICTPALAHEPQPMGLEFTGGYDYYITPNEGNNYNDAQGFNLGLTHPIGQYLEGQALFKHITDIGFPVSDDPKGSFGELRGSGGQYNLVFNLPGSERFSVYLLGGIGYYWWDFKENPFLQDNQVTVDVDAALALEGGIGLDYSINDSWSVNVYTGWFDTDVPKDARDSNDVVWNILDSNEIGLQYIHISASAKFKF